MGIIVVLLGAGIAVAGAVTLERGEIAAGAVGVALGSIVVAGARPFFRASQRIRSELERKPLDPAARRSRRRAALGAASLLTVATLTVLAMPIGVGVQVLTVVIALAVIPLVLIDHFDRR